MERFRTSGTFRKQSPMGVLRTPKDPKEKLQDTAVQESVFVMERILMNMNAHPMIAITAMTPRTMVRVLLLPDSPDAGIFRSSSETSFPSMKFLLHTVQF